MEVFAVLIGADYENSDLYGIFNTYLKAVAFIEASEPTYLKVSDYEWRQGSGFAVIYKEMVQ